MCISSKDYVSTTGRMNVSSTHQVSFVCSLYIHNYFNVSALCVTYLVCVLCVCVALFVV